ncbi:MAG: hypothetical protein KAS32_05115 [Candidatus Peribacteraceae bacterium]|nr:hypothetical protein [Candidatus Peribacteraceae bacterium]
MRSVREEIAILSFKSAWEGMAGDYDEKYWDSVSYDNKAPHYELADRILSLKYDNGQPKLGVIAEDQSLPSARNAVNKSYNDYMLGQEDMLKANFKRIVVEE